MVLLLGRSHRGRFGVCVLIASDNRNLNIKNNNNTRVWNEINNKTVARNADGKASVSTGCSQWALCCAYSSTSWSHLISNQGFSIKKNLNFPTFSFYHTSLLSFKIYTTSIGKRNFPVNHQKVSLYRYGKDNSWLV